MRKTTLPQLIATFIICYAFWLLVTWSLAWQELAAGAVVCLGVAWFCGRFFIHERGWRLPRPRQVAAFFCFCLVVFPICLYSSAISMCGHCFRGAKSVNPGIVKVPVHIKSTYGRVMLANAITLTPGTITMGMAEEEGELYYYIHWVDVVETDPARAGDLIKFHMEKWIRRIWD